MPAKRWAWRGVLAVVLAGGGLNSAGGMHTHLRGGLGKDSAGRGISQLRKESFEPHTALPQAQLAQVTLLSETVKGAPVSAE